MPSTSSKPSAKRSHPTFRPPGPAAKKPSKPKNTPRRNSSPALSSEESDDDPPNSSRDKSSGSENESSNTVAPPMSTQDPPPVIPPDLLTRILHYHLEKTDSGPTRIGKDADALVGKYMETFVREAIARAAFERSQAEESTGMTTDFLEVEDLEKLAPQLLLDF
ncbi:MAG: hypothetical protein Q9219_006026 [cf. Caloplaca sp. 3 TL-2023]